LHDALAADGNARIVSVSSAGHLRSPVVFDDINFIHAALVMGAAGFEPATSRV
jgi:hypothetical protein